ncbi:MAG: extracellular solute-binding protein [Terrimesophilobacter sp.]
MFRLHARRLTAVVAAVAVVLAMAGCASNDATPGNSDAAAPVTLTIYSDQHASLVTALTEAYTAETGVKFNIQQDATFGQIEAEGAASPADIFLSEDPSPVAHLAKAKLLEPLDASTMEHVQPGLSDPNNLWVAYAARTRVLFYNPTLISEADLPKSLLEIADPKYKGEFAWAPSGAFVATAQYLISTIGIEKTTAFLTAIKSNGIDEQKNGNVRDTVEAGKHAMGLSNHYYWWVKAAEVGGAANMTSKIYHFPETDAGNLVLSSGAAILASSKHKAEAAKFLGWLTEATAGQKIVAGGDIDTSEGQYPVALGTSSAIAGSLGDIKSPMYDMSIYGDQSEAENLLKKLGISG